MIDKETKDRAKNYPINELASRVGITLDRNNFCRCVSPNHEDNHPSMSLDRKNNIFNCFACGFKVDTIALVTTVLNYSFKQAVSFILEGGAGDCTHNTLKSLKHPLKALSDDPKELGEKYSDIYEYLITKVLPLPTENHYLCKERKISLRVLTENDVRAIHSDNTWNYKDELLKVFPIERLLKSGLIRLSKEDKPYLFFFKCIGVIPYYDKGRVVFLQGIHDKKNDNKSPKNLNLTSIKKPNFYYPKDLSRYNPKTDCISIVEGAIDTLSSIELNRKAIGVIDVGVSDFRELKNIRDFPIILIGDGDKAGFNLKIKLYEYLMSENFVLQSENIKSIAKNMMQKGLIKNTNTGSVKDMNDVLKLIKKEN